MIVGMDNAAALPLLPLGNISHVYLRVKELWIDIARAAEKLDYIGAVSKLKDLYSLSRRFRDLTVETAETLDVYKCIQREREEVRHSRADWLLAIAIAMDLIVLLLFILFRKKKIKMKIN